MIRLAFLTAVLKDFELNIPQVLLVTFAKIYK